MKTYTEEELKVILNNHEKWLNNDDNGVRAFLHGADLSGAYLHGANLRDAYLSCANLRDAYLSGANLSGANLRDAHLRDAYLSCADLSGANLRDADLRGAYLRGADLSGADLSDADLRGAYLRDADLRDAYLSGANLRGAFGNMEHVKSLQTETYYITYTSKIIQIGCQSYTIEEWKNFNNKSILEMDGERALEWWTKWKPIIMQIIEMSPCEPTKEDDKDNK